MPGTCPVISILPVMNWYAKVIHIKTVPVGTTIPTGSLACLCRLAELLARPSARVMLVHAVSQVLRPCFLVRKSPKLPQLQAELRISCTSQWLRWSRICLECRGPGFNLWVGKVPWRREWQPTPVFLPGKSHEQRSLAGYSQIGRASCRERV